MSPSVLAAGAAATAWLRTARWVSRSAARATAAVPHTGAATHDQLPLARPLLSPPCSDISLVLPEEDTCCATRYMGCKLLCCHMSCVKCIKPCMCLCPCCEEEQIYMDGDLKPLPQLDMTNVGAPPSMEMDR
mmetsp:Transcript_74253/g.147550  ORF Transcript_74253/g.147550 Transcript_74253/m.147550 type:complete len:132 (+) Transcript_74253:347-742(+)